MPVINAEMYQSLREGPPFYQLIDGQLLMSPSPQVPHQQIAGRIYRALAEWAEARKAGEVLIAPTDVYLNETNVVQPDVLFVSASKAGLISDAGVMGAPDLVVEVISPGSARVDTGVKKFAYAQAGVPELWLVDPAQKTVAVFKLQVDALVPAATFSKGQLLVTGLLPAFELKLQALFPA